MSNMHSKPDKKRQDFDSALIHDQNEAPENMKENTRQETLVQESDGVVSEYLPDLPPDVQAKLPAGKRLFGGCICKQHKYVTVYLLDADLWQKFREEGTEMIITKKGRRVFPVPSYVLCDLDPDKLYYVSLEILSVDCNVHKYSNGEWIPSKEGSQLYPTPVPGRNTYLHPYSPNTGLHWMREPINFSGLKISNNLDALGTVVLQSMRKYVMRLVIAELNKSMKVEITQPETVFVAVTQYQNEKITQMKIENNPFANAFRCSSSKSVQSKDKTKRPLSQEADSEDDNKMDIVSSTDRSPTTKLLKDPVSSGKSRPKFKVSDAARITEYLERKRSIFKQLFPTYFDQFKVQIPSIDQHQSYEASSWLPGMMATHSNSSDIYTNSSEISKHTSQMNYMFPCGEGNPLAEVRQFGQLNRFFDMESPLSLVKKKKMEDIHKSNNLTQESSHLNNEPVTDAKQVAKDNRRFPRKVKMNNEASCNIKLEISSGDSDDNMKTNISATTDEHGPPPVTYSPLSDKSSRSCIRSMSANSNRVGLHTNTSSGGALLDEQQLESSMIYAKSPKRAWMPSPDGEVSEYSHQTSPRDFNCSRKCDSLSTDLRPLEAMMPTVILKNSDMWATTNEVVISSEGRPMFPFISLAVSNFEPELQYHIYLRLIPSSSWLYDYNEHEWVPSVEASSELKTPRYQHPDSPKKGCLWGPELVFDKLRLSTIKQGKNMLKVQLRCQYVPVVTVESENQVWEYPLKDATFITVKIDRSSYGMHILNTRYSNPDLSLGRLYNENIMRTSQRKQTNPRRMNMDFLLDHREQVWPLNSWSANSFPLNLKKSINVPKTSPSEVKQHLLPASQLLSSSSLLTSTTSMLSPASSARSEKSARSLDSPKPDINMGHEGSTRCQQGYPAIPMIRLPSFNGQFFTGSYSESDADSIASNPPVKSPASPSCDRQDEILIDSVDL